METPKPRPHAELIKAWADGFTIQTTKRNGEWEDVDLPSWNEESEYRIRPDNEPWSPKTDEKYFYLDVVCGEFCACDNEWDSTDTDYALRRNKNIFPTKKEAEAMIPRIKDVLKGTTDVSNNVGSELELKISAPSCKNFQLDGKPLSEGEISLIRAIRRSRICRFYEDSVVVEKHENGVATHRPSLAFFTQYPCDDAEIKTAIQQIKTEQEANNE